MFPTDLARALPTMTIFRIGLFPQGYRGPVIEFGHLEGRGNFDIFGLGMGIDQIEPFLPETVHDRILGNVEIGLLAPGRPTSNYRIVWPIFCSAIKIMILGLPTCPRRNPRA